MDIDSQDNTSEKNWVERDLFARYQFLKRDYRSFSIVDDEVIARWKDLQTLMGESEEISKQCADDVRALNFFQEEMSIYIQEEDPEK